MKTMKMITNMELPTSFNSCAKKLLDTFGEKIEYSKQWYCITCKMFVNLNNQYMRNCKTCLKKYYISNILYEFYYFKYFLDYQFITIYQLINKLNG